MFGVILSKFLRFVVRRSEVEVDHAKIKAIIELSPPKNILELRGFQDHIAYINRFISNLFGKCQPFSRFLQKDTSFELEERRQIAFGSIEVYLTMPPVLISPGKGKPLVL